MSRFVSFPLWHSIALSKQAADGTLEKALIEEFPCRPHWTKNTREVFQLAKKNLDPDVSL
jgi:hypothetical protein